ncbi:MAG: hypothetical protein KDD48_06420 [Bdellovibrionales bacterium]|nr:hypothetical protein [Bdellovibrionales bacterium]
MRTGIVLVILSFLCVTSVHSGDMVVNIWPEADHDAPSCITRMERFLSEAMKTDYPPLALEGWVYDSTQGVKRNDQIIPSGIFRILDSKKKEVLNYLNNHLKGEKLFGLEDPIISRLGDPFFHAFRFAVNAKSVIEHPTMDDKGMSIKTTTDDIVRAGRGGLLALQNLRLSRVPGYPGIYYSDPDHETIETSYYESFVANKHSQYTVNQWQSIFEGDSFVIQSAMDKAQQVAKALAAQQKVPSTIDQFVKQDVAYLLKQFNLKESPVDDQIIENYARFFVTYRNYIFIRSLYDIQKIHDLKQINVIMHLTHAVGVEKMINKNIGYDSNTGNNLLITLQRTCQ